MTSAFDAARSASYDGRVSQMIVGYDTLHRLVEVCLAAELPSDAHVLMIGAGTGAEVLESGLKHPDWRITAVEPSKDMSAIALTKLKAQGLENNVIWHAEPLYTLTTDTSFDAATLLLVLHFVPEGKKLDFLTSISERLKPGAPLILSTFAGDPTTTRTKKLYALGTAWAIAAGLDPADVAEKMDLGRKDIFLVTEERIKTLLRDAGFIDIQRIYQSLAMTTWIARTPR